MEKPEFDFLKKSGAELKENGVTEESVNLQNDHLKKPTTFLGGSSDCYFVKKGGGWLKGDE